ncbi:MAG TPA: ABATE domain-containing protein [Candidatus Eisenbacteria bacterium]|nr:ABATE domain-containing protein [Candidatus Eisenbacteria bacterium]
MSLDFVNTLDDRFSNEPKEMLKSYVDLARFGEDTGILTDQQVDRFFPWSIQYKEEAEEVLKSAIELREAISAVFYSIVQRKPVPAAPLDILNVRVQEAARHLKLVPGKERFKWKFDSGINDPYAPIWPIARDAAELLASDRLEFVRACASKTCEWLFLDESKNHRRRWCDMTKCGNRAKAKRFYVRQKKEAN